MIVRGHWGRLTGGKRKSQSDEHTLHHEMLGGGVGWGGVRGSVDITQ